MKRLISVGMVLFIFSFASIALAGNDAPVSSDEGRARPVSDVASPDSESVVGDDIEIEDGEFKIISIEIDNDAVVGDNIEVGDGEAKIISFMPEEDEEKIKLPLAAGIPAIFVVAAGVVYLTAKKKKA